MTRRSPAYMRPAVDAAPRIDVIQSDKEALTGGGFTALLESAVQQILAVTYWFDPTRIWGTILSRSGFPGAASM